jgi:hypothetical protein
MNIVKNYWLILISVYLHLSVVFIYGVYSCLMLSAHRRELAHTEPPHNFHCHPAKDDPQQLDPQTAQHHLDRHGCHQYFDREIKRPLEG